MFNEPQTTHLVLGGDTMLGRLVKEEILVHGPEYPLSNITPILKRGDLTIVNLECAITGSLLQWTGSPKVFYFGAPPIAAKILADSGIHIVTLANNHILDFDFIGLHDTLHYLQQENIQWVGAGKNIPAANKPAIYDINNVRFGIVACCDHQEDFAALENRAGIAYLDLNNKALAINAFRAGLTLLQESLVTWPILSLHWGPNMILRPSKYFMQLAHNAIDMGFKIIFGHSAHVFHGVEIYHDCPIIYSAGDLVDDYYVDPYFNNDHQLLFELEILGTTLKRILLYPIFIESCQVKPANEQQYEFITKRAEMLCKEMGCLVKVDDSHRLGIDVVK